MPENFLRSIKYHLALGSFRGGVGLGARGTLNGRWVRTYLGVGANGDPLRHGGKIRHIQMKSLGEYCRMAVMETALQLGASG